jgi:hypothetical protein
MLDAESGGGSLDDWSRFSVPQMWAQLSAVTDAELTRDWNQVTALQRTYELLADHGARLRIYRDELAAKWPLADNPAAAAYVATLDQLVESIQTTADASANNHEALAGVIGSIMQAKSQVKTIHDEYAKNETALAHYQRKVDEFVAVAGQSDAPVGIDPGPPPVQSGRQQQLHADAMGEMSKISSTADEASARIVVPPPYEPPHTDRRDDGSKIDDSGSGSTAAGPPIVPPVHSAFTPGGAGHTLPPPGSGVPPASGPTLSGHVGTPTVPGGAPLPGAPAPQPTPAIPAGPVLGLPPTLGGLGHSEPATRPARGAPDPVKTTSSTGRTSAPRGVIGGPPAGAESTTPSRRVNPVGGVIGQPTESLGMVGAGGGVRGGTGTVRSRTSGSIAGQGVIGQPGGPGGSAVSGRGTSANRGGSRRSKDQRRWDPDDPFAVDGGVDPVLRANQDAESHDPAPGVIGIDR